MVTMATRPEAIPQEFSDAAVIRLSPEKPAAAVGRPDQPRGGEEGEEEEGGWEGVVARLRSRVEQQSSLIAMLKQRADETFKEVRRWGGGREGALGKEGRRWGGGGEGGRREGGGREEGGKAREGALGKKGRREGGKTICQCVHVSVNVECR